MAYVKHIFNKDALDEVTIEDIQMLIKNKTEEFLHLDYEQIPMKNVTYEGLAEHVSGFLNSSGGVVVFGVSEKTEKKRNIPHKITWSTIKKETLENNLYQKIDPWNEDIKIMPIPNPDNKQQRIFLVSAPKSKNPPHMANFRYYIRLNFQTKPIGHDQVLLFFRQNYLQKYDLINTIYNPLYSEITSFMNQKYIAKLTTTFYDSIRKERLFLLSQDWKLYEDIAGLYQKIKNWNKAVDVSPYRLAKIINNEARDFFKTELSTRETESAVTINIVAESVFAWIHIDQAVLNDRDPIEFWKENNPFVEVLEAKVVLETKDLTGNRDYIRKIVNEEDYKKFMGHLANVICKDDLIKFLRDGFEEIHIEAENLIETLEQRMK